MRMSNTGEECDFCDVLKFCSFCEVVEVMCNISIHFVADLEISSNGNFTCGARKCYSSIWEKIRIAKDICDIKVFDTVTLWISIVCVISVMLLLYKSC